MALGSSYLRAGDGVIDVGANRGAYATAYAAVVGPTGYVRAIEPHPLACAQARDACAGTPWVTVQQVAVSDVASVTGTLYASAHDTPRASLWPGNCLGDPHPIDAVVTTLDCLLLTVRDTPRLIKIDAQGAEAAIIRGATRALDLPIIWVLELWAPGLARAGATVEDVLAPFQARGYTPHAPDGSAETWASVIASAAAQKGHSSSDVALVPRG